MLDLMSFKEEFVSQCRNTLCEFGPVDMEIEERTVNKAQRGELNGLLFRKKGLNCAPTFYVEDFYKSYKEGTPIEELSHVAIDSVVSNMGLAEFLAEKANALLGGNSDELSDEHPAALSGGHSCEINDSSGFGAKDPDRFETIDEDTVMELADPELFTVRLLNKSRNKEYMKDVAYREAGCGFVFIAEVESGEYRLVITDDLLEYTRMAKDELFDRALKNTVEKYPPVLHDLAETVMTGPDECRNLLTGPANRAPAGSGPGFVLTNSRFFWGAGALFYPGIMKQIRQLLASDYYVLPSSVHELILLRVEDQDPQQLAELVRSANKSVVREDEILADDLYICEADGLHRVSYGGEIPACGDALC